MLADRWSAEAARRCRLLAGADRKATASWAGQTLARAEVAARQHLDSGDDDARGELVAAAAQTLEACAATWQAFGPVAGARRVHLVRRLERRLAEHERAVLAAEAGYRLDRQAVASPAKVARLAVQRLYQGSGDVAGELTALEDAALALAAAAIRAVENIDATGQANGRARRAAPPATASLQARFVEIHAHAEAIAEPRHRSDLASWLSECFVIVTPSIPGTPVARPASPPRRDQRPDTGDLRRPWLRLGARELLVTRSLAQPPSARTCSSEVVCALAADVLADTGLAARADAFDPLLAWEHQAAALAPLIPACARALRGDGAAAHSVHAVLVDRLARVVSALWLIDHQPPTPRRRAGGPRV